jgi:hypothetical protein
MALVVEWATIHQVEILARWDRARNHQTLDKIERWNNYMSYHSEINRITAARWLHDYCIELNFSDGFIGQLDLQSQLWGPVFAPLTDVALFRQFKLEDHTIGWPNGADFCPDVLRYWCEAGGVKSQAETDQYFDRLRTAAPAP